VDWSRPAPDECRSCGDCDEGFGDGGELLVVADEAAVLDDPGEGSFDHPAAAQHFETLGGRIAFDDLDDDVGLVLGPAHKPTGVAAIGKGVLDEGISRTGGFQHEFAAVAILDAGGMDPDGEEAAVSVGQDVALAAFDFLARVVALRAPF